MTERKALGKRAEDLFSEDSEEWRDLNGLSSTLIVKTESSEEISKESEVKTDDVKEKPEDSQVLSSELGGADFGVKTESSEELSQESEVKTDDVIGKPEDSKVLSSESREADLGVKTESSEDLSQESEVKTDDVIDKPELKVKSGKTRRSRSKGLSLNAQAMDSAIEEAKRNPRIGIYSPISTAALKYMKKTVPEFSISDDARLLLEASVARKYPDLIENLVLERGKTRTEDRGPAGSEYDMQFVERIAAEVMKSPKLTVWSPYAYAILKYLRKTLPEFSMSMEARLLLEDAVARKYPDLVSALRGRMEGA